MIRILFFGEIKEIMACDSLSIKFTNDLTVEAVAAMVLSDHLHDRIDTTKLLYAINQEQVSSNTPVADHDEVAIMTAFAGG